MSILAFAPSSLIVLVLSVTAFAQGDHVNYFPYSRTPRPSCLDGGKPTQDPNLRTLAGNPWMHGVCPEDKLIDTTWFTGPWSTNTERFSSGDRETLEAEYRALTKLQTQAMDRLLHGKSLTAYDRAYAKGVEQEATLKKISVAAILAEQKSRNP